MTQRMDYNAQIPAGMKAVGGVYGYILASGLPTNITDLAYLRASQINGCAFCIDMHSRDLTKSGMPVEKLALVPVWREAGDLFDAKERAALAWTESVTLVSQSGVPDEDYAAAREQFDEVELANLTVAIGLINLYNRLGVSFRPTPQAAKAAN